MVKPEILVTGATGSTGKYTVQQLLKKGYAVRALVHRQDERAKQLASLGAEVVVGDLLNLDAVQSALTDIKRAYFVYPVAPGIVDATAIFACAGKQARLEVVVNMSQKPARREAKSWASRNHWLAEQVFNWSGLNVTHLRPTFFAEWFLYFRSQIATEGKFQLPFGDGKHAPIAAEDQARVIVGILEHPQPHQGQVYELYGPVEMTHHEIAAVISKVLSRTIVYENVPLDNLEAHLRERKIRPLSPYVAQHVASVAVDYQQGVFEGTNDVVATVGKCTPMTIESFIAKHWDAFQSPLLG
jgi:NAD(P)H dehydrogenase (quinone)